MAYWYLRESLPHLPSKPLDEDDGVAAASPPHIASVANRRIVLTYRDMQELHAIAVPASPSSLLPPAGIVVWS
jgi:hypothetical protein